MRFFANHFSAFLKFLQFFCERARHFYHYFPRVLRCEQNPFLYDFRAAPCDCKYHFNGIRMGKPCFIPLVFFFFFPSLFRTRFHACVRECWLNTGPFWRSARQCAVNFNIAVQLAFTRAFHTFISAFICAHWCGFFPIKLQSQTQYIQYASRRSLNGKKNMKKITTFCSISPSGFV